MFNRYRSRLRTKTTSIAASNPFVLDQISTPSAAAYSLRKLRGAYTGNAVRVRRSSDNTELDVGFASISQNLAVNGDFSNGGTGWTLSNASVSGGVLNVSGGADFIKRNIGLVQGKKYWFSFDYTCSVGANLRVNNGNANGSSPVYKRNAINGTSGKIQGSFIATSTSGFFAIEADANTFTGTIDNIIVCEVGLAGNDLDLYAITQFCAPSGGSQSSVSSGFVTAWYDQSGNSRNAVQVIQATQPQITNAGVFSKGIEFFGAQRLMAQLGAQITFTAATQNIVVLPKSSTNGRSLDIRLSSNGTPLLTMSEGISNAAFSARTATNNPTAAVAGLNGSQRIITGLYNGKDASIYKDGVFQQETIGVVTSSVDIDRIGIGSNVGPGFEGNNPFFGVMSEIVIAQSAFNNADRLLIERNQGAYYNVTVA